MSIYYIEEKNGDFFSTDGKRRFIKLTGKQAYIYLKQHSEKRFYKTSTEEENGEKVYVEIPNDKLKAVRKTERREQYVSDCENDSEFTVISMFDCIPDGDMPIEETLKSGDSCLENIVEDNWEIEVLHKAINSLSTEEFEVINMLFLSPKPMTEKELGEILGVSQQMISKRKDSIIKKLKNFF